MNSLSTDLFNIKYQNYQNILKLLKQEILIKYKNSITKVLLQSKELEISTMIVNINSRKTTQAEQLQILNYPVQEKIELKVWHYSNPKQVKTISLELSQLVETNL